LLGHSQFSLSKFKANAYFQQWPTLSLSPRIQRIPFLTLIIAPQTLDFINFTADDSLMPKERSSQSHDVIAALYNEEEGSHLSSSFLIESPPKIEHGSSLMKVVLSRTHSVYHIIFRCTSTKARTFLVKQRKVKLIGIRPKTLTDD